MIGRDNNAKWANEVAGPSALELVTAIADTAMESATREGYDSFSSTMRKWQQDLINYRCALSRAEVKRLRGSWRGWNCRELKIFIGQLRFDQLDPAMEAALNKVPTRLKLPREQVDLTIRAGRLALQKSTAFRSFLSNVRGLRVKGKRRISPSTGNAPRLVRPD